MSPKEDRDAILARRRILIASALIGVVGTGCKNCSPGACLKIAAPIDASHATSADDAATSNELEAPAADGAGVVDVQDSGIDADDAPPPRVCLRK